jgi:hypothetical protein
MDACSQNSGGAGFERGSAGLRCRTTAAVPLRLQRREALCHSSRAFSGVLPASFPRRGLRADVANNGADKDRRASFSRPLPGRFAWANAIRWFPPSALRIGFTDRPPCRQHAGGKSDCCVAELPYRGMADALVSVRLWTGILSIFQPLDFTCSATVNGFLEWTRRFRARIPARGVTVRCRSLSSGCTRSS